MLTGKMYVVTSPDLVAAVNRNSKALAFNPFIAELGKRITGHDERTGQIVQHSLNGEQGPGYVIDVHDEIVAALAPGSNLEDMMQPLLQEASLHLDALSEDNEVELFGWTRTLLTMCSTRAIYGPDNPFGLDSNYSKLFWDFNSDLNLIIADIFPTILAPKGTRARSELGLAFQQYYENYTPGKTRSSAMTRARHAVAEKHGLTSWNQGRLEVGSLLGILANTVPSAFYLLIHIYANGSLLRDIRDELEATSVLKLPLENKCTFRILSMREKCLLLQSSFQEMLRVHALDAGARFVREDTLLDGRYLLKKGMVVQMPMAVMHSDPSIWGPDVGNFQPRRFLKQNSAGNGSKQSVTAYRPFGGGASMCPGRHFVAMEILTLTAWIVLRFDIAPSSGVWSIPAQKQESLATNVFPPEKDIKVKITERRGFEDTEWDSVLE
ncbi:hypothetical protein MMC13_001727 [Lambiella insularis]|nr:hypothetical protein [Lambiella insularis]